jgi:cation transport protein ChaC
MDDVMITRDSLVNGTFLKAARAAAARAGIPAAVRSDAEIEERVTQSLAAAAAGAETWVFAYGSLMWNPTFRYIARRRATLPQWQRRFCIWLPAGRGSVERPGLTLGLEPGGQVDGIAFRLPPGEEAHELTLVFRREMLSDGYNATWVTIDTADGLVPALTFVVNGNGARYAGALDDKTIAGVLASAKGVLGSSADYLWQTIDQLAELGICDPGLAGIAALMHRPPR